MELENIEVARKIIDAVGASEDIIEFVDDRPGHDQRYALDTEKIESIGWEPQWTFDEGLEKAISYYLEGE
jgi:dTDP-glucose 4,6-dehydratase